MLSESELVCLQATMNASFPDDCRIERPSLSGNTIATTLIGTVKALAVLPASGAGTLEDWGGTMLTGIVRLPVSTDVQKGDILTIKSAKRTVQELRSPRSYELFMTAEMGGIIP